MNDTEARRIAGCVNMLRPDWPIKQLRTLLSDDRLAGRPRRDVVVALVWIASDSNTKNPYRVFEAGPWWKAVVTDETTTVTAEKGPWCRNCGCGPQHPIHRTNECVFSIRPAAGVEEARRLDRIAELRREVQHVQPPPAPKEREPEKCGDDCTRGYGHTGPHQPPDEDQGASA